MRSEWSLQLEVYDSNLRWLKVESCRLQTAKGLAETPVLEALTVTRRVGTIDHSRIVYDPSLVDNFEEIEFDQDAWSDAPVAPGYSGGRGKTLFIGDEQNPWVLRHYYRGGFTGTWLNDAFVWIGEARTRPFIEWLLLERLVELGLPVPRPVAGRYVRRGWLYTADLITVLIPDVVPLSTRWAAGPLDAELWRRVGRLVARFHVANVYHADLTAHNIQIDSQDELFLLDFDRGRIMSRRGSWSERNLNRLHRSLTKISGDGSLDFSDEEWGWLLSGYRNVLRG
jgi:3-deoxy-D-manno-octulosonic acid kinase